MGLNLGDPKLNFLFAKNWFWRECEGLEKILAAKGWLKNHHKKTI